MQKGKPEDASTRRFIVVKKPRPLTNLLQALDHAARVFVIVIGLILCIHALMDWAGFLIPVVAGLVAGLMLSPAAGALEKRGLPEPAAATCVLLVIAALLYVAASVLWAPVLAGLDQLPALGDALQRRVDAFHWPMSQIESIDSAIEDVANGDARTTVVEVKKDSILSSLVSVAPPAFGQVLLFAGTTVFFLFSRQRMRKSLLTFCFTRPARLRTARIMRDVEFNTSRYLLTISAINAGLGVAVGTAMWLLGLEYPIMWGVAAALLNFIPYIGPAMMVLLLAGVGLLAEAPLSAMAVPPLIYLAINFIEFQFVTPATLGRSLTLSPFAVFLSISFWLWLWGPVGAFLAVPLLLIMVITIKHLFPG